MAGSISSIAFIWKLKFYPSKDEEVSGLELAIGFNGA